MVKAVQASIKDPDVHIATWLEVGAPMGISLPIDRGLLFPEQEEDASLTVEELHDAQQWSKNHPSFEHVDGTEEAPGTALMQEYLEKGFCRLFKSVDAAQQELGGNIPGTPRANLEREAGWQHEAPSHSRPAQE